MYISVRSIDEVNVQIMMEQFGGGGHINMAGAQLENVEVETVKDMIRKEIDRMIEGRRNIDMQVILLEDVKSLGKRERL